MLVYLKAFDMNGQGDQVRDTVFIGMARSWCCFHGIPCMPVTILYSSFTRGGGSARLMTLLLTPRLNFMRYGMVMIEVQYPDYVQRLIKHTCTIVHQVIHQKRITGIGRYIPRIKQQSNDRS